MPMQAEEFEYASSEDICASRCSVAAMMLPLYNLVAVGSGGAFDLVVVRTGKKSEWRCGDGRFSGRGKRNDGLFFTAMRREETLFARGSSEVRMSNVELSSISVCGTPCMKGD